jgi:hypothetical protein
MAGKRTQLMGERPRIRWARSIICAALVAALGACGFEPMPVPDSSAIKPGPGLLSGKAGEFVIPGPW